MHPTDSSSSITSVVDDSKYPVFTCLIGALSYGNNTFGIVLFGELVIVFYQSYVMVYIYVSRLIFLIVFDKVYLTCSY